MAEGISVSVDPAEINKYIAEMIIESALGERLKETVDEALKGLTKYGNDPLKSAVQSEIRTQVINLVSVDYALTIEMAVREAMTPEFIGKLVSGFMDSVTANINKRF